MIRHWQTVWLESLFEIRRYFLSYPLLLTFNFQMIFSLSFPRCPERRLEQNTSTQFLTVHLQGLKTTCSPLRLTLGRMCGGGGGGGGGERRKELYCRKRMFSLTKAHIKDPTIGRGYYLGIQSILHLSSGTNFFGIVLLMENASYMALGVNVTCLVDDSREK